MGDEKELLSKQGQTALADRSQELQLTLMQVIVENQMLQGDINQLQANLNAAQEEDALKLQELRQRLANAQLELQELKLGNDQENAKYKVILGRQQQQLMNTDQLLKQGKSEVEQVGYINLRLLNTLQTGSFDRQKQLRDANTKLSQLINEKAKMLQDYKDASSKQKQKIAEKESRLKILES